MVLPVLKHDNSALPSQKESAQVLELHSSDLDCPSDSHSWFGHLTNRLLQHVLQKTAPEDPLETAANPKCSDPGNYRMSQYAHVTLHSLLVVFQVQLEC